MYNVIISIAQYRYNIYCLIYLIQYLFSYAKCHNIIEYIAIALCIYFYIVLTISKTLYRYIYVCIYLYINKHHNTLDTHICIWCYTCFDIYTYTLLS